MTAINQDQLIKKATRWSIFGGILTIIAGVLAISLPLATGLGLTLWLGVIFSFVGIAQVVFAFKSEVEDRLAFILELLVGFFYLAGGIILLLNPFKGLIALTAVLAAFLLVEGILELMLALKLRYFSSNWIWILAHGILSIAFAVLIWAEWPSSSTWVVGLLIGLSIITNGISRIMLSLVIRSLPASQQS